MILLSNNDKKYLINLSMELDSVHLNNLNCDDAIYL